MFLDEAIIGVQGGRGGAGCVAWRREKFVPRGGPAGGDGGRGGDLCFVADPNTDTLSDYASRKRFASGSGEQGSGSNRHGADGQDLILPVPPGTTITEVVADGNDRPPLRFDLVEPGEQCVVARGGRGGFGNAHFKSSTRQRPDFAELGDPGEERRIKLELKLVADVGIIGYPSVGKSTLISVISAARPKIADYPFTTLVPNLGVVQVAERSYVVCDVPGLIEGASEGKGLGHQFLKHIERCGLLLHLLDLSRALPPEGGDPDPSLLVADYHAIRKELAAYSPTLAAKKEFILLNKSDLVPDAVAGILTVLKKKGITVFQAISAATQQGTEDLKKQLLPIVLAEREHRVAVEQEEVERVAKEIPVLRPQEEAFTMSSYRVEKKADVVVVRGARVEQFTRMTNFLSEGALLRFRDVLDRIGLRRAIQRERGGKDLPVRIGDVDVTEFL